MGPSVRRATGLVEEPEGCPHKAFQGLRAAESHVKRSGDRIKGPWPLATVRIPGWSRGAPVTKGSFYEIVSLPERRSALGEQAAISNDNANT